VRKLLFDELSDVDLRIASSKTILVQRHRSRQAIARDQTPCRSRLFEEHKMTVCPPKPTSPQSAQSHDWDARATKVIAEAREMPLGQRRSDALEEAVRLRIAAEMKRMFSTK
jgi:hypothetical protein